MVVPGASKFSMQIKNSLNSDTVMLKCEILEDLDMVGQSY